MWDVVGRVLRDVHGDRRRARSRGYGIRRYSQTVHGPRSIDEMDVVKQLEVLLVKKGSISFLKKRVVDKGEVEQGTSQESKN